MADLIQDEIRYATLVGAEPTRVYAGIATAEGLDGWFTKGASVDPRPGGILIFRWVDFGPERVTGEAVCPILEAVPGRRFVFQWEPDSSDYFTTVEITFEAIDEGTIIRLREYGYEDTASGLRAMLDCSAGWGEALTLWKFYIEHGVRY
jgi:uncharacterized protein YndB with AHSA1/START domain